MNSSVDTIVSSSRKLRYRKELQHEMKKFVATYKIHRGAEWFDTSIRSIADYVDGVVVAMSEKSWDDNGLPNNCIDVAEAWKATRPDWLEVLWVESSQSSDQAEAAIDRVREQYGQDTAILVIDTDEIWQAESLFNLRREIENHPEAHYFTSNMYSYLKDPRYQVYPVEINHPVVALQNATPQRASNRFQVKHMGRTLYCPNVWLNHFTYVRADEAEVARKFSAISTQETIPSNPQWLKTVWPHLPDGTDLHMTPRFERCWKSIKILPAPLVVVPSFCDAIMLSEDSKWLNRMANTSPDKTIVPVPTASDAEKYPEFARLASDVSLLRQRLKMTYLEALVLSEFAKLVPDGGRIIEIGSGSGGSMAVMALSAPSAKLWTIDPFTPYDETNITTVRGAIEGNEAEFWQTAKHYGYENMVLHIPTNSDVAVAQFDNGCADLVLVDGNHTYEIVKKDIELYWPKVVKQGYLLVHDTATRFPGVMRAVCESNLPFRIAVGTTMAYVQKRAA